MEKIIFALVFFAHLQVVSAIRYEVTAPNILRLNVPETVGISITGNNNENVEIELYLQDSPGKTKTVSYQRFVVKSGKPEIKEVIFTPNDIPDLYKDDEVIFVYLVVKATKGEFQPKEILIPVKKYSGYAFLQTDKPIYLPSDPVHIRVLNLNEKLLPNAAPFVLEIKNPNGHRVLHNQIVPDASGITETQFRFPILPLLGNWSVSVYYGYQMTGRKTVHFEVKEYVLPTFSVEIEPPKFILNTQKAIHANVKAKYVYGKPVQGVLNVKFAIRNPEGLVFPIGASRFNKLNEDGEYYLSIDVQKDIIERNIVWFPEIIDSNLLIEVEVIEKATGIKETTNDYSSIFTTSPYKIVFPRSTSDFKPGVPYELQVDVQYSNGRGAPDIMVQMLRAVAKRNGVETRQIALPMPLKTNELGRVMFKFDTVKADEEIVVTVATQDEGFDDDNQAVGMFTIYSYKSPDQNSYVWISAPSKEMIFKVGSTYETDVTIYPPEENIKLHYMVISRGTILHMAETESQAGAQVRSIQFSITPDMSPSARLLVYIVRNNKIIADSLKIEIEEKCKYNDGKELKISAHTPSGFFKPDQSINLRIEGEVDSSVGVLAVDKAVYILSEQDLLTREKLFSELTSQDFGCGPGGGVTTESVLRNVGVVILTNSEIQKHDRQECGDSKNNKKRSISGAKVSDYSGLAATCCRLGQLEGPSDLDCIERAEIIYDALNETENCSQAFLDCCQTVFELKASFNKLARSVLGRKAGQKDVAGLDIIEVKEADALKFTRWIFPEMWIFKTYKIGSADCKNDGDNGICEVSPSIPHSITTWSIQAVGVSQKNGMCVAKPFDVVVFRSMFIQMKLPYAAIRGEQIQIPVTIFNYDTEDITVTVYMIGVEGVCMGAGAGEKSEIYKVKVESNSAFTVTFPVMPLEVASFPLKVVALSWSESDAIEKQLKVLPEGIPTVVPFALTLDPSGFIRHRRKRNLPAVGIEEMFDDQNNRHSLTIDLDLPDNHVPGTGRCQISLMGDIMGQVVSTSIQGLDQRFFRLPSGCGEQTMITFAPLVYTMIYLKRTDKLNSDFEKNGFKFMQQGYSHLMQYRKNNGAFSVWTTHPPSLWLTSFVGKVLCQAESFIPIPEEVRCGAIDYITKNQKEDGSYDSSANVVHHVEMTGGIEGDVTTTAFVLISLLLCDKCSNVVDIKISKTKAVKYLEDNLEFLNQPFALSVVTYALALAKSPEAEKANEKLKALAIFDEVTDSRFWNWDPMEFSRSHKKPWVFLHKPSALAVETTSYALLAQLQFDDITYSHPIVNWLNQQRNHQGSFVSTQDTVMALQALSEYAYRAKLPSLDMVCNISSQTSAREGRSIVLNNANSLTLQQLEVPIGGKIHVDVTGVGVARMQVALHYNIEEDKENKCKFDLHIKTKEYNENLAPVQPAVEFDGFNELPEILVRQIVAQRELKDKFNYDVDKNDVVDKDRNRAEGHNGAEQSQHVIQLEICTRYLEDRAAGMSILEVGLFTGYQPVLEDIDALTNDPKIPITQYEKSDRAIIFYLDKVPHNENTCIKLRTYQEISVGKVQPTTVKIYDYYEPDKSCLKFYKPDGGSEMLKPICEGKQCRCIEGQCPSCFPFDEVKKLKFDDVKRRKLLDLACDKHDYVWSGTLKNKYEVDSFVYYEFRISEVLKEGIEKKNKLIGKTIKFTGRQACACPEMRVNKNYFIMGKDGFQFTTADNDKGYKYLFDKSTSVYENRMLKDILDPEENNLQKIFNWLNRRMVDKGLKCDH